MELKQNICVYIEIAGGALSPLSIELLGKARQLADAKGKKVVAFVAGADTAKASQEAISYGADAVAAVEDGALAAYDSVLYTKAIAALAENMNPVSSSSAGLPMAATSAAACRLSSVSAWSLTARTSALKATMTR